MFSDDTDDDLTDTTLLSEEDTESAKKERQRRMRKAEQKAAAERAAAYHAQKHDSGDGGTATPEKAQAEQKAATEGRVEVNPAANSSPVIPSASSLQPISEQATAAPEVTTERTAEDGLSAKARHRAKWGEVRQQNLPLVDAAVRSRGGRGGATWNEQERKKRQAEQKAAAERAAAHQIKLRADTVQTAATVEGTTAAGERSVSAAVVVERDDTETPAAEDGEAAASGGYEGMRGQGLLDEDGED